MKLSFRSPALCTAVIGGLLVLTACGKKEEQNTAPAASTTAPAAATTAPAAASTAGNTAPSTPAATSTAAVATPAVPAAGPAAPTAASESLKIGSVTLGNAVGADKKVAKGKNAFVPTDKTIYASVATEGTTAGATLNAKWSFQDGETTTTVSDISQSISTDGPAVTTFKIQNPNEWPEGKYKVVISLNGQAVGNQAFDIKKK